MVNFGPWSLRAEARFAGAAALLGAERARVAVAAMVASLLHTTPTRAAPGERTPDRAGRDCWFLTRRNRKPFRNVPVKRDEYTDQSSCPNQEIPRENTSCTGQKLAPCRHDRSTAWTAALPGVELPAERETPHDGTDR